VIFVFTVKQKRMQLDDWASKKEDLKIILVVYKAFKKSPKNFGMASTDFRVALSECLLVVSLIGKYGSIKFPTIQELNFTKICRNTCRLKVKNGGNYPNFGTSTWSFHGHDFNLNDLTLICHNEQTASFQLVSWESGRCEKVMPSSENGLYTV